MYIHFNGNPCGLSIGDCVIRAISIVTGYSRYKVYAGLCLQGFPCTAWGNSNAIWANYLHYLGYKRFMVSSNTEYTVADFARDHQNGRYVLGTGSHAVAVINGDWVDSWDSGQEIVQYYFTKER